MASCRGRLHAEMGSLHQLRYTAAFSGGGGGITFITRESRGPIRRVEDDRAYFLANRVARAVNNKKKACGQMMPLCDTACRVQEAAATLRLQVHEKLISQATGETQFC